MASHKILLILILLGNLSISIASEEENCAVVDPNNLKVNFNCAIFNSVVYKAGLVFDPIFYNETQQFTWDLDAAEVIPFPSTTNKCSHVNSQMDIDIPCVKLGDDFLNAMLTAKPYDDGSIYWELEASEENNMPMENIIIYSDHITLIRHKESTMVAVSANNSLASHFISPDTNMTFYVLLYKRTDGILIKMINHFYSNSGELVESIDSTITEESGKYTLNHIYRKFLNNTIQEEQEIDIPIDLSLRRRSKNGEKTNCDAIVNAQVGNSIDSSLVSFCDGLIDMYFDHASWFLPSGSLRDTIEKVSNIASNVLSKMFDLYAVSKNNKNENTEVLETGWIEPLLSTTSWTGHSDRLKYNIFEGGDNTIIELSRRHAKDTEFSFRREGLVMTINRDNEYYSEACDERKTDAKICYNFYEQKADGTILALSSSEFHKMEGTPPFGDITTRTQPLNDTSTTPPSEGESCNSNNTAPYGDIQIDSQCQFACIYKEAGDTEKVTTFCDILRGYENIMEGIRASSCGACS